MSIATRALSVGSVLLLSLPMNAMGQKPVAAIVEKISGTVMLKQNGKQITLNPKTDIARRLFAGDSLHCEQGAKLTLRVGGRFTELDDKSGWFTIPSMISTHEDPRLRAIEAYGRIGGRSRGPLPLSILYSPMNQSATTPDSFTIRWTPLKSGCVASFVLEEPSGSRLWDQTNVDGTLGVLSSDSARQALLNYRSKSSATLLRLKLVDSCGDSDEATFDLLSVADEQALKTELAQWDSDADKLLTHLGRASAFSDRRMFFQAAEEYEAALALAPDSHDLIDSTIGAERKAGNLRRAMELEKRLAAESNAP